MEVVKIEGKTEEPEKKEPESKSSMMGGIKILAVLLVVAILTGGIVYLVAESKYKALLEEKDVAIALAKAEAKETPPQKAAPAVTVSTGTELLVCEACHGVEQTKGFHTVNTVKLLDEAEGKTPRLCTICHGSSPHNVHQRKLSDGEMLCGDCHLSPEGDYVVPQALEGMLLVCEKCHPFGGQPEDAGNYISIHITEGNKECNICHMGDPIKVHKKATENLGIVG